MKLTDIHKREPVLIAAVLVAVLNLVLGKDSGLTVDTVTTAVTLLTGLLVRSKVTPVAENTAGD